MQCDDITATDDTSGIATTAHVPENGEQNPSNQANKKSQVCLLLCKCPSFRLQHSPTAEANSIDRAEPMVQGRRPFRHVLYGSRVVETIQEWKDV